MESKKSPYLLADETFLSNKEARAYIAWHSYRDAERVANDLNVSESTAWSYKYRVNGKLARATRTASLKHHDRNDNWVPFDGPETVLDETFFNTNARGTRGSREHALAMVEAHMMHEDGATLDEIGEEFSISEDEADRLLGEAAAIKNRAQKTVDELTKIPSR